jgi:hypothetical protein
MIMFHQHDPARDVRFIVEIGGGIRAWISHYSLEAVLVEENARFSESLVPEG